MSPHHLHLTCTAQLLNADCRASTIQKLLIHRPLNSSNKMFGRVDDRTVALDYFAAIETVEQYIEVVDESEVADDSSEDRRSQMLKLLERPADPVATVHTHLQLAIQLPRAGDRALPLQEAMLPGHGLPIDRAMCLDAELLPLPSLPAIDALDGPTWLL